MSMVSPKLRRDMARRTRAVHVSKPAPMISGNPRSVPRSSSLPAAARPRRHDPDNIISARSIGDDHGSRSRSTTSLTDLKIAPTKKDTRMARSVVPPPTNSVTFHPDVDDEPPRRRKKALNTPRHVDVEQVRPFFGAEENLRPPPSLKAADATPAPTTAQQTTRGVVEDQTSDHEGAELSGDSLSGTGGGVEEGHSSGSSPTSVEEEENVEFSHEKSAGHALDLGMPGKLLELMEDRDKAVHLCLQYRCKLKTTENSLRTEERRASGLKRQLRAATAAGESTKKLFDQMMEKARAEESERLRRGARVSQDEESTKTLAEDARKVRLQLARGQRDLRDLWLERDELAALAKQATEGEQAGRKRAKQLEQVNARLRQKAEVVAMSGKKAKEEIAHAEARALAAEVAERDLRTAVEAIKRDFEVLVCDLHLREKRIEHLEEENCALTAAAAVVADPGDVSATAKPRFPHQEHPRLLQNAAEETRTPVEDETAADIPAASIQIRNTDNSRSDGLSEGGYVSRERRASNTGKAYLGGEGGWLSQGGASASNLEPKGTAEAVETSASVTLRGCEFEGQSYEGGGETATEACAVEVSRGMGKKYAISTVAGAGAGAAPNVAAIVRPSRRQLNPQFAVIPGRVTSISYPRCGSRVKIERPVEKKPLNKDTKKEPGGNMEAVGKRASGVAEKAHADTEKVEPLDVTEKAYDDAGKLEAESGCGGLAGSCPTSPLTRRLGGEQAAGLTPAPPLPSRPANLSAEFTFTKTAPLLSDGSVRTVICTPDAKLRGADKFVNSLEDTLRLGEVVESASAAEETKFGGKEGISGSTEGGGHINGGAAVESAATTQRLATNDLRFGEEGRHQAPPNARVGEGKGEAHSFEIGLPMQATKSEDPLSDLFASRLVDGVPVLKYGGKGKPKPKVLWVTPDLSELFYTRVGRTKNSKRTSHMRLAGLHAARGRSSCPEVVNARHDRCFSLLRDSTRTSTTNPPGDQGQSRAHTSELTAGASDVRRGSTAPGRLRWGIGSTLSSSWRRGSASRSMGRVSVDEPGSPAPRPGARERMGLETASVEECDALVAEINHLVRRAGSEEDVVSSRGQEIFHAWCKSAVGNDVAEPSMVVAAVPRGGIGGEAQTVLVGGQADT